MYSNLIDFIFWICYTLRVVINVDNQIDELYKDDIKNINDFLSSRPSVMGCYCYAIGDYFYKRSYKLVIVVDDIWSWQQKNNDDEFSMYSNTLFEEGYDYIDYIGIKDNNNIFDYTLMNGSKFISDVYYWNNIMHSEIFQKPIIKVKSFPKFDEIIDRNRQNALVISALSLSRSNTNFYDLMLKMYSMSSYLSGEMVSLVNRDYDLLKDIYEKYDFINFLDDFNVSIDYDKVSELLVYLPNKIKSFIDNDYLNINCVKYYLKEKKVNDLDEINYMLFLINGLTKLLSFNGRNNKVKTISK